MPRIHWSFWLLAICLLGGGTRLRAAMVIHEIHYHAASHDPADEFVELLNNGTVPVRLDGWRFDSGVQFVFPPGMEVAPGGMVLVVAAPVRWVGRAVESVPVLGPWAGRLSNSGEELVLRDASGRVQDRVPYAQDGDWARRLRGPEDFGHRGWVWEASHDGGGRSLELIQPRLPNEYGQNWRSSAIEGGTPGRANSVAEPDIAPLVVEVRQDPMLPVPTDAVVVRARIWDEDPGVRVEASSRAFGSDAVFRTTLRDDGLAPDRTGGDGEFAGVLAAQAAGSVVEFWFEARDAGGQKRVWPPPVIDDGVEAQAPGALYAVETDHADRSRPAVRLILRPPDLEVLRQINRGSPAAPFPTFDQTRSHATFDGTFVAMVDGRAEVRYRAGIRNRGNGSRLAQPQSFRINFLEDQVWDGRSAINLAGQAPELQIAGSRLVRAAGLPAATSRPVLLRVNGVPETTGDPNLTDAGTGVFHALNEVIDAEFLERQFPLDSAGAVYRAQRQDRPLLHAGLEFLGDTPDPYRPVYFKRTETSLDDWTDLIGLARVLMEARDDRYVEDVLAAADVDEWVRYFAVNVLLDNRETSPVNGHGDDYFLIRGERDRRFRVVPYDLDSILGGGGLGGPTAVGLFPMLNGRVPVFARFLTNASVQPRYRAEVARVADLLADPRRGLTHLESGLVSWVSPARRAALAAFLVARADHLRVLLAAPESPATASARVPLSPVFISEWRAASRQDETPDFVELRNAGSQPVDLTGYALTDQPVGRPHRGHFPPGTILGAGAIAVWIADGVEAPGHVPFRLKADEGEVALVAPDGTIVDHVFHDWQPRDVAMGRRGDASRSVVILGVPTPGVPQAPRRVRLSEVMVVSKSGFDEAPRPPWIEVVNESAELQDLDGLVCVPSPDSSEEAVLRASAPLAPGERRVFELQGFSHRAIRDSEEVTPSYPPERGSLFLRERADLGGGILDAIAWGPQVPGSSLARSSVGTAEGEDNWHLAEPSPAETNRLAIIASRGRVRVNEWMAAAGAGPDWVELLNLEAAPIPMEALAMSDDPSRPFRFAFPRLSFLGSGRDAFLYLEAETSAARTLALGFSLAQSGESLQVANGERTVDEVRWAAQESGISSGRFPDGEGSPMRLRSGATPSFANAWAAGVDANTNGLPDAWEADQGWSTGTDPDGDPDGDGHSSLAEWRAGSDPNDARSVVRVRVAAGVPAERGDTLRLEAWVPAGREAVIESNHDLGRDAWVRRVIFPAAMTAGWRRVHLGAASGAPVFFRVRLSAR